MLAVVEFMEIPTFPEAREVAVGFFFSFIPESGDVGIQNPDQRKELRKDHTIFITLWDPFTNYNDFKFIRIQFDNLYAKNRYRISSEQFIDSEINYKIYNDLDLIAEVRERKEQRGATYDLFAELQLYLIYDDKMKGK